MIAKYTIIKIKYRENTNNYPTERLTCMMLILDMEKRLQQRKIRMENATYQKRLRTTLEDKLVKYDDTTYV